MLVLAFSHFFGSEPSVRSGRMMQAELPLVLQGDLPAVEVGALREVDMVKRWAGKLVAARRQVIVAAVDAEVEENKLAYGRIVREGELLLRLRDNALFNEQLTTARKIARLRYNLQAQPAEVLHAQQAEYRVRVELSRLQAELATQRELFQHGLISRLELQGLEQRQQDAKAQLEGMNRDLVAAKGLAGLTRADWQSELTAQQELQRQQANKRAALEVHASFDGRVRWVADIADGLVKRGSELAILESHGDPQVELRIIRDVEAERQFTVGTQVAVSRSEGAVLPGVDGPLQPTAAGAGTSANASPEAELHGVVVSLNATQASGDVGMEGGAAAGPSLQGAPILVVRIATGSRIPADWALDTQVDVRVQQPTRVLELPTSAVVRKGERTFVYVRAKGVGAPAWSRREVFGSEDGGSYWIGAGLAPGETVARVIK